MATSLVCVTSVRDKCSWQVNESCHTYEWLMPLTWMKLVRDTAPHGHVTSHMQMSISNVTQTNESCHTNGRVISHLWMSHVTHMNEPCKRTRHQMGESRHTYECVMSHVWMSLVTHMNESCQYMWMSHITTMTGSCHTYEGVMSWLTATRATYCNILQHIATHCNTLMTGVMSWLAATHATYCNILQHTATHCNTFMTRVRS